MEKLSLLIRGALAEMRSLLLELRPGAPTDQSLSQLLNTLANGAGGGATWPSPSTSRGNTNCRLTSP